MWSLFTRKGGEGDVEFIYQKGGEGDGAGLSANPRGAKRREERWEAGPFKGKVAYAHWGFAPAQSPHKGLKGGGVIQVSCSYTYYPFQHGRIRTFWVFWNINLIRTLWATIRTISAWKESFLCLCSLCTTTAYKNWIKWTSVIVFL